MKYRFLFKGASAKNLSCVGGFGCWGVGGGGLSQSVKKGKFVTKIFLSDIVEWSSKNLQKMIPPDVKANNKKT